MAVNQPDYTPAGMIQAGTVQYQPVDDSNQQRYNAQIFQANQQRQAQQRANQYQRERDMRLNQYQIEQEKRAEQLAVRNELSNLNAAGLPKEMQGEINYDLEQYNKQLESGELQVGTPEEAMARNRIKSKIANFEGLVRDANAFALSDTQVISQDELGYLDTKPQVLDELFSWQSTDFDPNNPISNRIGDYQNTFYNATPRQQLDAEALDKQAENFIERNAQYEMIVEPLRQQGFRGVDLIQQIERVDKGAAKAFEDYLMESNYVALGSMYADRRKYAQKMGQEVPEMNTWMNQTLSPWKIQTPRYTDEQDIKYTRFQEGERNARANQKKQNFEAVIAPVTIQQDEGLVDNLVANEKRNIEAVADNLVIGLDPEEAKVKKKEEVDRLTTELKDQLNKGLEKVSGTINKVEIVDNRGKNLEDITVGGQTGTLSLGYLNENGDGVLVVNTPVSSTIYGEDEKGKKTSNTYKVKQPKVVKVTASDVKALEKRYGVSLTPQQNQTKTETPEERAARIARGG